jgi:hypothetical protein
LKEKVRVKVNDLETTLAGKRQVVAYAHNIVDRDDRA